MLALQQLVLNFGSLLFTSGWHCYANFCQAYL